MQYLLKTEPSTYSFEDLQRDGTTVWDGITNPQAVKFLREMKPGSKLLIYHSGDERRVVGTGTVVSVDAADPKTPKVRIKAGKPVKKPIELAEIKSKKVFADSLLLRQTRLSVVPLTPEQYKAVIGG